MLAKRRKIGRLRKEESLYMNPDSVKDIIVKLPGFVQTG